MGGFVDGTGRSAQFNRPSGLATDTQGNLYVADLNNHAIRKITPQGVVTTYAGTGQKGARNGPASQATFNLPYALAVDSKGNIYVAEQAGHTIRKIKAP